MIALFHGISHMGAKTTLKILLKNPCCVDYVSSVSEDKTGNYPARCLSHEAVMFTSPHLYISLMLCLYLKSFLLTRSLQFNCATKALESFLLS